jgi:hypothetical protein
MLAMAGIINIILLPSSLNRKPEITNEEFDELEKSTPKKVGTSEFFKNRRVIFALFSLTMQSYFVNFK